MDEQKVVEKNCYGVNFSKIMFIFMSISGGHIESDISNIYIFVNIDIVSKQIRKYRYFDIKKPRKNSKKTQKNKKHIKNTKGGLLNYDFTARGEGEGGPYKKREVR